MSFAKRYTKTIFLTQFCVFLLTAVFSLTACEHEGPQNQYGYNSDRFDLSGWKLTVPVGRPDNRKKALEVYKLEGYASSHFFAAADGAMVFKAPVNGVTTSGSKYPRSELREMNKDQEAAWKLSEGGTMTATLKVDKVPKTSEGDPGRIIVGQIHGEKEEPIRLYWDKETLYFMNDRSGDDDDENKFEFHDANGETPSVSLGEKFSYKIDVRGDTLDVTVYADGKKYTSVTKLNPVWNSDTFYFKAGVYLGVNKKQGAKGFGQVSFYALDYSHVPGKGLGGLSQ
jgi:hypothetical protein